VESWCTYSIRGHALLVIDDPDTQSSVAAAVHARGFGVISRSTPLDALQALEETRPRVAIAAAALPNGAAHDLLDYLAETHPTVRRVLWATRTEIATLAHILDEVEHENENDGHHAAEQLAR